MYIKKNVILGIGALQTKQLLSTYQLIQIYYGLNSVAVNGIIVWGISYEYSI